MCVTTIALLKEVPFKQFAPHIHLPTIFLCFSIVLFLVLTELGISFIIPALILSLRIQCCRASCRVSSFGTQIGKMCPLLCLGLVELGSILVTWEGSVGVYFLLLPGWSVPHALGLHFLSSIGSLCVSCSWGWNHRP